MRSELPRPQPGLGARRSRDELRPDRPRNPLNLGQVVGSFLSSQPMPDEHQPARQRRLQPRHSALSVESPARPDTFGEVPP